MKNTIEKLSFVIPCYCSEKTIRNVVQEIETTMDELEQYRFEIILIDDCSSDNTFKVIERLSRGKNNITGISLARNFGQHSALMAGFHYVNGDLVICLDDDGQTPANETGKLINKIQDGYDVVYASYDHKEHSLYRNIGSRVNDLMTTSLLEKPSDLKVTSFFAVKRYIIDKILEYKNSYPYVIGLVLRTTKSIANVPVKHRKREEGTSGYTFRKLFSLWFNGFTAFSVKPLRLATLAGTLFAFLGFIYLFYIIIRKVVDPDILLGWSSMMAMVLLIGGIIMLMLGIIGEYVGRIYISINNSPQYVVREIIGKNADK